MRIKVGDLAFVPASSRLIQLNGKDPGSKYYIKKHRLTKAPYHLLVVGESTQYYNVLYEGEEWATEKRNVYSAQEAYSDG